MENDVKDLPFVKTDKVRIKKIIVELDDEAGKKNESYNIHTLADQIGVHRVIVSNVINNHPKISKGLRQRVQLKIANALGLNVNEILASHD